MIQHRPGALLGQATETYLKIIKVLYGCLSRYDWRSMHIMDARTRGTDDFVTPILEPRSTDYGVTCNAWSSRLTNQRVDCERRTSSKVEPNGSQRGGRACDGSMSCSLACRERSVLPDKHKSNDLNDHC